jgi:hypothetical protein
MAEACRSLGRADEAQKYRGRGGSDRPDKNIVL